jgi:hypothetical protein
VASGGLLHSEFFIQREQPFFGRKPSIICQWSVTGDLWSLVPLRNGVRFFKTSRAMRMKSLGLGLLATLILATGGGCKKSPEEAGKPQSPGNGQPSTINSQPSTTIAQVHWLGKKQIAAQKTSGYVMSLWDMPEAARLESQTLDKLAMALTGERPVVVSNQVLKGSNQVSAAGSQSAGTNNEPNLANRLSQVTNQTSETASPKPQITNQPPTSRLSAIDHPLSTKLRPLLDDLVGQECYLEIQQVGNQPGELALAMRLDDQRAELWTSNLTAVLGSMTNVQSLPALASRQTWSLPLAPRPSRLDVARVGDWMLLGVAAETNRLLAEMSHRIRTQQTPISARASGSSLQFDPATRKVRPASGSVAASDYWLDVDLDLGEVSRAMSLDWHLPEGWPRITATWTGQGDRIRTAGRLSFAKPLDLQLEPWNIPTNLIRQPLVSFTAVRGVRTWLADQAWVKRFQVEPLPNELCAWASGPTPLLTFAAIPIADTTAMLRTVGPRIASELNPWVTNSAFGVVEFSEEPASLAWSGIPMFTPEIQATATTGGSFLLGRVGAEPPGADKPAPPELFAQLMPTNLVYYDWELTQAKLNHWVFLGQTARLVFVLPQMPSDSAAYKFILAAAPKLGNAGTEILQDSPASLRFVRNSTLGFTGVELHLLADWLESPAFPRGLHSTLAPRPPKWRPTDHGKINIITPPAPGKRLTNSPATPH